MHFISHFCFYFESQYPTGLNYEPITLNKCYCARTIFIVHSKSTGNYIEVKNHKKNP